MEKTKTPARPLGERGFPERGNEMPSGSVPEAEMLAVAVLTSIYAGY
jgi:hypothetical protein